MAATAGSPPRVWGNPRRWRTGWPGSGFTPTRVGKSVVAHGQGGGGAVHPHACGEIGGNERIEPLANGSPPRVWGNLMLQLRHRSRRRFTPTRVGKSR